MSKFQKCPKSFPKASKRVLNVFWGEFFDNFFCPVFHGWSSLQKFPKKSKNFQNSNQKRTKPFPKESKSVLNKFWGKFFEKIFAQFSMGGRVFENFQKKQRIFKVPKKPKIVTKSVQTCFELVLGQIFPKKLLSQCSMEARVLENFQKNQKNVKIPKMPKIVPKSIQTCFEHVLGRIFRKIFCPVFHGCSSLRNFSKKIKKFSKFQPKTHKTVPKRIQKCFEQVLGQIFRENFCPVFHGGSSLRKFSKKTKNFQSSKKAENRYQKCPNVF